METARRKSKLVLRLLSLGHAVLFSDIDVVWISDPLPQLQTVLHDTRADFVMQSDRSDDAAQPLNHNLNSGFYLARSNARTITALRAVIKYSYAIRRSEQKAFNYVLCGAFKTHVGGPGKRVGDDRCLYRDTHVVVLPTASHPNGSNGSLWDRMWNETEPCDDAHSRNSVRSSRRSRASDMWMFGHHYHHHHRPRRRDLVQHGNFSATFPQVTVVHANYVVGRQAKVDRIRQLGYWCFPSSFSAY